MRKETSERSPQTLQMHCVACEALQELCRDVVVHEPARQTSV